LGLGYADVGVGGLDVKVGDPQFGKIASNTYNSAASDWNKGNVAGAGVDIVKGAGQEMIQATKDTISTAENIASDLNPFNWIEEDGIMRPLTATEIASLLEAEADSEESMLLKAMLEEGADEKEVAEAEAEMESMDATDESEESESDESEEVVAEDVGEDSVEAETADNADIGAEDADADAAEEEGEEEESN